MKKINLGRNEIIHFVGSVALALAQIMKNMGFKVQGGSGKNKNI